MPRKEKKKKTEVVKVSYFLFSIYLSFSFSDVKVYLMPDKKVEKKTELVKVRFSLSPSSIFLSYVEVNLMPDKRKKKETEVVKVSYFLFSFYLSFSFPSLRSISCPTRRRKRRYKLSK